MYDLLRTAIRGGVQEYREQGLGILPFYGVFRVSMLLFLSLMWFHRSASEKERNVVRSSLVNPASHTCPSYMATAVCVDVGCHT